MNLFIITGGTGGHIFPVLEIWKKAVRMKMAVKIFIGGMSHIPLNYNIPFEKISASPIMGKSIAGIFKGLFSNVKGFFQSLLILSKKECVILASGGYPCLPFLSAAKFLKKPYFLMEQNSIPGRVVRYFSRGAQCTFTSFSFSHKFIKGKVFLTGNPVRFKEKYEREKARKILGIPLNFTEVFLVYGGSQGSEFLNNLAINLAKKLQNFFIIIITGKNKYNNVMKEIRDMKNVQVFDFYEDMKIIYSAVDFAITRAGSGTIFELLQYSLPSLLIPYPYSADSHQIYNAIEAKKYGSFEMLSQEKASTEKVIEYIEKLSSIKEKKWRKLGLENSEEKILNLIKKKGRLCFSE